MDRTSWTFWKGFGGVEPAAAAAVAASTTSEVVSPAAGSAVTTAPLSKPAASQGNGHPKPGPAKQHPQGKKRKR
jgi:hypothetical protein